MTKKKKLIAIEAPVGSLIVPKEMIVSWALKSIADKIKKTRVIVSRGLLISQWPI